MIRWMWGREVRPSASYIGGPLLRDFICMHHVFLSNIEFLLHNLSCVAEGTEKNLRPAWRLILVGWLVLLLRGSRSYPMSSRIGRMVALWLQTIGLFPLPKVRYG